VERILKRIDIALEKQLKEGPPYNGTNCGRFQTENVLNRIYPLNYLEQLNLKLDFNRRISEFLRPGSPKMFSEKCHIVPFFEYTAPLLEEICRQYIEQRLAKVENEFLIEGVKMKKPVDWKAMANHFIRSFSNTDLTDTVAVTSSIRHLKLHITTNFVGVIIGLSQECKHPIYLKIILTARSDTITDTLYVQCGQIIKSHPYTQHLTPKVTKPTTTAPTIPAAKPAEVLKQKTPEKIQVKSEPPKYVPKPPPVHRDEHQAKQPIPLPLTFVQRMMQLARGLVGQWIGWIGIILVLLVASLYMLGYRNVPDHNIKKPK
jgi:hypothetical protein